LPGGHPWRDGVRERTGAAVVAVERSDKVLVEFDDAFMVQPKDKRVVCSTPDSLERYLREFETTLVDGPGA
jgi:K+/H+ antiporter YhaU regulatory subunit KhtT